MEDRELPENYKPSGAESVNPYDSTRRKGEQVEEMFDTIASAYDKMNTAMTLGLDRGWRDRALDMAAKEYGAGGPREILDLATGTGEVAFELYARYPEARITGLDLSEGMLAIARKKLSEMDEEARRHLEFRKGDALAIDAPDNTFDLVTVAYGVRNFERLDEGYREIYRVLRPGGTLCVIELSVPEGKLTGGLYKLYTRTLIPLVGKLASGDSRAYSYLPESIAAAPQRRDMALKMAAAGFRRCRWKSLTFGAVTFYLATK
ncbi:MAG: bifunctional demethylmenaquinone methyltransferase/2-methoxy-6-polyprenyl-1,4-benzoquinol methylase UbiE [Muribaculaceae bacterium]|nr:bifunctional demethylmenaquinone methyltransferase/2-methoxy-6-polyprenyl-1,4-benzoquinol methylase UbiE [Muribaculaceae bacterium]